MLFLPFIKKDKNIRKQLLGFVVLIISRKYLHINYGFFS